MPLILGTNSIKDTGFNVANSLRFNDDADKLSRTPSSDGNQQSFTVSFWSKRGQIGANNIMVHGVLSNSDFMIYYNSSDQLQIATNLSGTIYGLNTDRLFRDPSAWLHIVVSLDTTSATASSRIKVYINGSQETSLNNTSYPPQNSNISWNKSSLPQNIGHYVDSTSIGYKGYIAEFVNIDGSTLTPTSFGEFDEDTGIWKPIDVSGLTFGTNGFYLDFENSGSLGADVSGNGNNFTVNNLTSIDQTTDTCTNNFATMNPLASESGITFSEGNLKITSSTDGAGCGSTMAVKSGKWYFEVKYSDNANYGVGLGRTTEYTSSVGYTSTSYNVDKGGNKTHNSSFSNIFSLSGSNIIGFALDCDNQKIHFSLNGNWYNNNNSSTTLDTNNPDYSSVNVDEEMFAIYSHFATQSTTVEFNFGNPAFTISSGNSDGNGYGNFEYSVPSGYYALNTKNLAEYG
jgi:hypothetical protein